MDDQFDIALILGRLEGKVDAILSQQREDANELREQDGRLRKLEARWAWLIGSASASGFGASALFNYLG